MAFKHFSADVDGVNIAVDFDGTAATGLKVYWISIGGTGTSAGWVEHGVFSAPNLKPETVAALNRAMKFAGVL